MALQSDSFATSAQALPKDRRSHVYLQSTDLSGLATAPSPRSPRCSSAALSSTWGAASTRASTIPPPRTRTSDGLRTDVMAALREQAYTIIRYPGGNFLSGYNWLDGVGPKAQRPRRRELAWQSIETNQFGTNEFMSFCSKHRHRAHAGRQHGHRHDPAAADLVEYCNAPAGTYYADLRAANGYPEPHDVQVLVPGQRDGRPLADRPPGRARLRRTRRCEAAKMMKWQDPTIETVLCGSSNDQHAHLSRMGSRCAGELLGARGLPLDPLSTSSNQTKTTRPATWRSAVALRGLRGHAGRHPALCEGQAAQQARRLSLVGRVAGLVQGRPDDGQLDRGARTWPRRSTTWRMRWWWRSG